ncbi:MAG: PBP1A family penicillin-binding protein [Spirochaetales bacterium]|nr:PBP1A family penicillin-binding protein [Spirochaetales bacterium]
MIAFLFLSSLLLSLGMGLAVAKTVNLRSNEEFGEVTTALPSVLLDVNGRVITEFFSDEKRENISVTDLPKNLIYAIITREDASYFYHNGISVIGTLKAVIQNVITGSMRGASTITQQLAGNIYADRTDLSVTRKLKELWYSFQMERQYTKGEILEKYLNRVGFGHNTYGVETASEYYFNHTASENTIAESAMLVIQVANPTGRFSPYKNPDFAKDRQTFVINEMADNGYIDREKGLLSLDRYWLTFDWSKDNYSSAFYERDDKAPWFSEYIRNQLDEMLFGQKNIYRDGYIVHSTLDLDAQAAADRILAEGRKKWTSVYEENLNKKMDLTNQAYTSVIDLLSLAFNIEDIRVAGKQELKQAKDQYYTELTPIMDVVSLMLGIDDVKYAVNLSYAKYLNQKKLSTIQTALLTLGNLDENEGYITAMIGGNQYDRDNKYNRALQGTLQPGSSFKPLYYSAAIASRQFTPATRLWDGPIAFTNPDGTYYTPLNYKGTWEGHVLLRRALATSMNVPSLQVLDGIGFVKAINMASALMGIDDEEEKLRVFPRLYPLGLGIIEAAPIQMAQAYATISNEGRRVTPLAIRYVEDRKGSIILNPEKELREEQKKNPMQILTPQEAYIMTSILHSTTRIGTLRAGTKWGTIIPGIELAGKTGTTQNWSDAWTCGFSPYFTTVMWAGFDRKGATLGVELTGSTATGMYWGPYMAAIHEGLAPKSFERPETGIVEIEICTESGKIPTDACPDTATEIFLAGTEPTDFCDYHIYTNDTKEQSVDKLLGSIDLIGDEVFSQSNPLEKSLQDVGSALDSYARSLGLDPNQTGDSSSGGSGTAFPGSTTTDSNTPVSGLLLD